VATKPKKATPARLVLKVPRQLHHELKVYAAVHQQTMAEVIQWAFEALKKAEKQKPA
jgi:hypothetical protein